VTTGDGDGWLADYQPIAVDVSSLGKFARALRDEADVNFRPHAKQVVNMLDAGASGLPGRPDAVEWESALGRYGDSRDELLYLLELYERVTLAMAEAAEIIVRRYGDSDAFARATRKYGLDGLTYA
jgi:hypothetical protein